MKKVLCFSAALLVSTSVMAEESWWSSLLNTLGFGEQAEEVVASAAALNTGSLDVQGLIGYLTNSLNISEEQASGGIASLMNYAKQSLGEEKFATLANQLPGAESILSAVPDVSNLEQNGLGGLLDKAAQFSDSLGSVNELNKQFEALGLDTTMIMGFVEQAQNYLDTPEGQEAKQLLMESFTNLQL
ncbi:DUF2780 domain-containing protein [Glaciecola sp. XM2]|uniref:DUF2780 domain-containing protein n=1 Tax=Glaciecola sp. XM2 TaxID=1914931 RepID=UPI001BDDD451|nr:DUF2780 domain-containing protein [Glaciecola sp. XM2]MBT1450587.1 DUF2780 domain-containing protein [Glaciecola sp. XM2]